MKTFLTQTIPFFAAGIIAGFTAMLLVEWLDYEDEFNAGYIQGQIDQAATQKELRKGICD